MIRTNINTNFPHHLNHCTITCNTIYVADYTEQAKSLSIKRGTVLFDNHPPTDINYFTINKFIHKNSLNDNVCAQNPLYS